MSELSIEQWIRSDPSRIPFRQAVHTVLSAIAGTPELQTTMTLGGGILLAIRHESDRFTKDIDFSSSISLREFDIEKFKKRLNASLANAVNSLTYGLDCRVQKCKQNPGRSDSLFPTIEVSIGYAYKGERNAHKRLVNGTSPTVVTVDYSLNEPIEEADYFEIAHELAIKTYTLTDLLAEKFRALLQQEVRNRIRRQDIYDLDFLIKKHSCVMGEEFKAKVHRSLLMKAGSRSLLVDKNSMKNEEIIKRSRAEYHTLAKEISRALPSFEETYSSVQLYFESLPWKR